MINLELYRVFYYAAREGNISKASQLLHLTQPSASNAIKQLEESLGAPLFYRTSRGVKLTPEGEMLYTYVEQAYGLILTGEKKLEEMANLKSGAVRIAASISVIQFVLIPHLQRFNETYPDIRVHLEHSSTNGCLKRLKEGAVDFCILRLPIEDDLLVSEQVGTVQDCFVAGERYRHLDGKTLTLQQLAEYPLIVFPPHMSSRQTLDRYLAGYGVTINPVYEIGSLHIQVDFAKAGLGISYVVRDFVKQQLAEGSLFEVGLEPQQAPPPIDFGVVRMKHFPPNAGVKRFIEMMTEQRPISG